MKKRVMIVDDEAYLLKNFQLSLKRAGYDVETAERGQIALDAMIEASLADTPFDLLITDILMPEMSGFELLDNVRKARLKMPVIAVTGYGDKETVIELMRKGCADFIDKPFGNAELIGRVNKLLGVQEGAAADTFDSVETAAPTSAPAVSTPQPSPPDDVWKTITPGGDISPEGAEELRQEMVKVLDEGATHCRIDLRNVHDIHTIGLTVFLCFGRMLDEQGSGNQLEVVNTSPGLKTLFHQTGMEDFYVVHESARN